MNISDDVVKALIATACGFAGTLVSAAISWGRDGTTAASATRHLDNASKRVALWDQWFKVSTQLPNSPAPEITSKISADLAEIANVVAEDSRAALVALVAAKASAKRFDQKVDATAQWRRALLLYTPARRVAWIPRAMFYAWSALMLVDACLFIGAPFDKLFWTVMLAAISETLIFRALSRWLEQPRIPR